MFDKFIKDPVGTLVKTATQPISDVCDVVDGLMEGEIREKAAIRLGVDVVSGMALSEIIEALEDE